MLELSNMVVIIQSRLICTTFYNKLCSNFDSKDTFNISKMLGVDIFSPPQR